MKKFEGKMFQSIFVIGGALLILFARRPSAFLSPQFWAEDGRNWYADAYNHGILFSLTTPENGYFQTFSRLIAILSQTLPLKFGPILFLAAACVVQITTAVFIISPRMSGIVPSRNWRILLAFLYLAIPHSWEIHTNITNSQWHLALLACLILLAEPAVTKAGKIFDIAMCMFAALSGPFSVLLLPISLIQIFRRKNTMSIAFFTILLAAGAIQSWAYFTAGRTVPPHLEAGVEYFFWIVSRHLLISPLIGGRGFERLAPTMLWSYVTAVLVTIVGTGTALYAFVRGRPEIRLVMIFAVLIVCAALASPAVTREYGQWPFIASNEVAFRYWFIPTFAIYVTLVCFASSNANRAALIFARVALIVSLVGVIADFRLSPFEDLEFQRRAEEFEAAPTGAKVTFPINPDWDMTLIKK